jgi:tetratricopeptide (TPR) repeat protein
VRDSSAGDRKILLAIVLIALALRLAYVIDISNSIYFQHPTLDSFWYDAKAQETLRGDALVSSGTFRMPLYVYFMAGIYAVFGRSLLAVAVIQAIIGALTCGLIYRIGRRLFGTGAGVVAGLGFALYGMAVYAVGEVLAVTLLLLLLMGGLYFILDALDGGGLGRSLAAGACLGLAFLTRPDVLPFAALAVFVLVLFHKRERGPRIALGMGAALVCFMLLAGLRNYAISKEFFIFSPQGAVNLYIGNARYADGKTPVAPPVLHPYDIDTDPSQDSITLGCRQAALENTGRDLSDRELSSYYAHETFHEIKEAPLAWIRLIGRKIYYFMNSYEQSDIKLIPRIRSRYSRVLRFPLIPFAAPLSLGLVGTVLVIKRRRRSGLLAVAGLIAYAVNPVMFFVLWRFRLPAAAFLMLLAGFGAAGFYGAVRKRDIRLVAAIAVGVVVLALVSVSHFWGVAEEAWVSQYLINEAGLYLSAGDYDRAVEVYEEAARIDPGNARVYYYLGKAHATEGRFEESKGAMEKAVRLNPVYEPYAMLSLGVALAGQGRYEPAAGYFREALALDGNMGLAAFNLGISMLKLGRFAEAETAFTRAEKVCKEDTEILVAIAEAYVVMGRNEQGISLARRVLESAPHNADALYTVGLGLEAEGKTAEALRYYEAALGYRPGSADILQKIRDLRSRGVQANR